MRNHLKLPSQISRGLTPPCIYRVQPNRYGTTRNILAGVPIRIRCVTTSGTSEQKTVPIRLIDVPTTVAHPRSVPGGDRLNRDPLSLSLISDTKSELTKRPPVDPPPQSFSLTLRGFSNITEILKDNFSSTNGLSPSYKSFRSNMHRMPGYGSLMSRHSPKELSGRASSNRLYPGSMSPYVEKFLVQMVRSIKQFIISRIGCYKESLNSLIDPHQRSFDYWFGNIDFIGKIQIPLFSSLREFRVLPVIRYFSEVIKSNGVGPKSDTFFGSIKVSPPDYRDQLLFEGSKAPFLLLGLLGLVGRRDCSEKGTGKLGREIEFFSYGFVVGF